MGQIFVASSEYLNFNSLIIVEIVQNSIHGINIGGIEYQTYILIGKLCKISLNLVFEYPFTSESKTKSQDCLQILTLNTIQGSFLEKCLLV